MTTLSEKQLNDLSEQLRETTLEDLLLVCIRDTGLMDTVGMLDIIATESGHRIAMYNWKGRSYPAAAGDLVIPAPPWKQELLGTEQAAHKYPIEREMSDVLTINTETTPNGETDSMEESEDNEPEKFEETACSIDAAVSEGDISNPPKKDVSEQKENDGRATTNAIGD